MNHSPGRTQALRPSMLRAAGRKRSRSFNAQAFLDAADVARKIKKYRRADSIFLQGDASDSVMYIQEGGVKLSVRSTLGKEAVVAMLGPGDFFGEGCLAGQPLRMGGATAITTSTILVLKKKAMLHLLHKRPELADRFINHMLGTNIRIQEDLVAQLFNHDEKRLARALLLLARYGKQGKAERILPRLTQVKLARMAGTTPAKIGFFIRKFKRLGFIEDDGGLTINTSLLSVVLHE